MTPASSSNPGPEGPLIGEIVDFVTGIQARRLPAAVAADGKRLLLDAVASAWVGSTSKEAGAVSAAIRGSLGPGAATVIAEPPSSPAAAAAINGYLITARSLCDVHRPTLCHTTPVVVPAALAAAERAAADGATLLAGLIAGLEVTVRLGYALRYEVFRARGWHTPGVAGPIGAAAATARIAGLDRATTASAIGIAGSQAGGTFASFGTPTIKFHQARAAMAGLLAADLAAGGLNGNPAILTAEDGGLLTTFSDGGDPAALVDGLGEDWRFAETETRRWPAAAALQTTIAALLDLRDVEPEEVVSIDIALPPESYAMNGQMTWEDTFHATLSSRWVAAVTLWDGDFWLEQCAPARLADRRLSDFAEGSVRARLDATLPEGGCALEVRLRDGRRLVDRRTSTGESGSERWRGTEAKALRAAEGVVNGDDARRIVEMLARLEELEDVGRLMALLGRPERS